MLNHGRRLTVPVMVGDIMVGGNAPIRVQSMTSTSTMDTEASVNQIERIAGAGGEIVRLTAQGVREAANLANIKAQVRKRGINTPLVADIHFNPKAAFEAAKHVEKVRINPGNFVDPGRTFKQLHYTDQEYADEQKRIAATLVPFLQLCRENNTTVRIGVNHGSLSDRIMSRYGDTPMGMVESAMEYLRIAVANDFTNIIISIKASNTVVMVQTVRRLVEAMDAEDMHFPLHLGVTEAGDGDDGRIKSAVGIGTLLAHGIGDTIRVSLSEEPECEIPVANALVNYMEQIHSAKRHDYTPYPGYNSIEPQRFPSISIGNIGSSNPVAAINGDNLSTSIDTLLIDADSTAPTSLPDDTILTVYSNAVNQVAAIEAMIHTLRAGGCNLPIVAHLDYNDISLNDVILRASVDAGTLLLDAMVDGIELHAPNISTQRLGQLERDILQAARCRFDKTEFISCPGCGRTLYDLQSTLHTVKAATSHLPGLKIAVMGCIVNGPGEMADADYGYVGAAAGKISLYRKKECIERNIPQQEALQHLIQLIKSDDKWQDPAPSNP